MTYLNIKLLVVWVILMVVLFCLGYYFGANIALVNDKNIRSDINFGLEVLRNPMVYKWKLVIKGELISKDAASITLGDNYGNTLHVPVEFRPYVFTESKGLVGRDSSLKEIPIGAKVVGEAYFPEKDNSKIIGDNFNYKIE